MAEPTEVAEAAPSSRGGADLGRRAARGSVTTLAGQVAQLALQMTSVVVLARLLSPHDYGLFALVLLVVGVGEVLRDFGLSSAAVQAERLTDAQRDTLFWINAAIGVALALVLLAGAPLVALAFGQPELEDVCRALSAVFVVNGVVTQYRAGLVRGMRFGTVAGADLSGQVASVATALVLAAAGAGYWALVASQLAQVVTILVVVVSTGRWVPGRPRRGSGVRPMLRYGTHFVGAQLVTYGSNNIDTVVIGLRLGPSALGLYTRAFQLVMNPLNQLRIPATTVALPTLSRLNDQPERRDEYVRRGQAALGFTTVVGLGFAAGAATPLVQLLLGERWLSAAPLLALLAVAAGFQMLSFVGYWVYISRGLTRELFQYSLFSLVLRLACVGVGSQWGLVGVAAGYALAPALAWPVSLWWLGRTTPVPQRLLYRGALAILVLAAFVGLAARTAVGLAGDAPAATALAAAALAGCAAYAAAVLVSPRVRADVLMIWNFVRKAFS